LAAGHEADAGGPRRKTDGASAVRANQAKAAPSIGTADTRQTQTNEEGEAEGPFGPMKGTPMRLVGRTATHARYICTGQTCRQTYEKPLTKN
jgi:hypothetical protein